MPLRQRIIKVTIDLPTNGNAKPNFRCEVRVPKEALAIQSRATIEVVGLSTKQREYILSHFTAWIKREVDTGVSVANVAKSLLKPMGWPKHYLSIIFKGEVTLVEPVSGPLTHAVRITAPLRIKLIKTNCPHQERPPAKKRLIKTML